MNKLLVCSCLFLLLNHQLLSQEDNLKYILEPGAKLEKLAGGFSFTEGPTADKKGNVYFTDQPNDKIFLWNEKTLLSSFMEPASRSNGLALDAEGNIWSCADEKNELLRISPDKKIEVIAGGFNGKLFNGPNDLWITPAGGVYFTDPFYSREWWSHKEMPQEKQRVYYMKPDHKTIIVVAEDLSQPNGIVGTPDGKTLYVADIRGGKTWSYTVNADGSLANKSLFCEMGSDGITMDSKGNLYLTGKGVTVFDNTGKSWEIFRYQKAGLQMYALAGKTEKRSS